MSNAMFKCSSWLHVHASGQSFVPLVNCHNCHIVSEDTILKPAVV